MVRKIESIKLHLLMKILLGLAWLWKTWQETAPGPIQPRPRPQAALSSIDDDFEGIDDPNQTNSGIDWRAPSQTNTNTGDSLNYPGQPVRL